MELNNVERWLEAYFAGETTLEQEKKLQEYFISKDVAPHLQEYVPLFSAFAKAKQERYTGEINLPRKQKKYPWMGIAASILLIIGLFLTFDNNNSNNNINSNSNNNNNMYGSYNDPEVAARKTRQALFMMGSFIDQSTSKLQALDEFEKTKEKYLNHNN